MKKARISWIVSMIIYGTIAVFVRGVPVSSGELALCRAIMAAVLIGGYLAVTKNKIRLSDIRKELLLLLLSGMAMGINWILLFEAYKYTTVSTATLSYYFAPVLVTAVCPFLFGERLTRRQLLCFLMSTLGVVLIIGVSGRARTGTDLTGVAFGLGAAVFYASVILLNKFIRNVTGLHRTFLQFLAAILILIPYVAATTGLHLEVLDQSGWINLLIVGLFHTGLAYCLYFSSLKELRGQEAAILSYIDPLVAVLVSVVFLGEGITPLQAVGGCLILGFAILNERQPDEKERIKEPVKNM